MDDAIRDLERAVRANPDDPSFLERLNRARGRMALGFSDEVTAALVGLGFEEHHVALALAMVLRDLHNVNWGVRVLISCTCNVNSHAYGPAIHDPDCRTLYATCRCYYPDTDRREPPNRYEIEIGKLRIRGIHDVILTSQNGEQVRAWCRDLITDDGKRIERWLEILATMRSRHVLVVDSQDA